MLSIAVCMLSTIKRPVPASMNCFPSSQIPFFDRIKEFHSVCNMFAWVKIEIIQLTKWLGSHVTLLIICSKKHESTSYLTWFIRRWAGSPNQTKIELILSLFADILASALLICRAWLPNCHHFYPKRFKNSISRFPIFKPSTSRSRHYPISHQVQWQLHMHERPWTNPQDGLIPLLVIPEADATRVLPVSNLCK